MNRLSFLGCCLIALSSLAQAAPDRWEEAIRTFEAANAERPPTPGGILFVGSASIRLWQLDKWFSPELNCVNRGFGGSTIPDQLRHFDRVVVPHAPATVVFYCGDNDINDQRTPEQVATDFAAFVARLHQAFPECRLLAISIKPSIQRWELAETMQQANRLLREQCEANEQLTYVDVWATMLNDAGEPRPELFLDNGLHLSEAGFELWTGLVKAALGLTEPAGE